MGGQPAIFHALLRPAILQILRATGYHATRGAVLDSLTDLAARYLAALCEATAAHATHNHGDAGAYTAVDVRIALQDVGALLPERADAQQAWRDQDGGNDDEDTRGVDDFVRWFAGPRMRDIADMARPDADAAPCDYLGALKKKHSKAGDDTKYHGTLLGRAADGVCDMAVEGGPAASIDEWVAQRRRAAMPNGLGSPAASSGLSSVGDRLNADAGSRMDLA